MEPKKEYHNCPNCESKNINKILYGLVHEESKRNPDDKLKMFPEQQGQKPYKLDEAKKDVVGKSTELGGCKIEQTIDKDGNMQKISPDWHCRDCDFKWPHADLKKKMDAKKKPKSWWKNFLNK